MYRYAVQHIPTGNLCGFNVTSNDGRDFCDSVSYELNHIDGDNLWLASTYDEALHALDTNAEWYNAGYNTPEYRYERDQLRIVRLEINII